MFESQKSQMVDDYEQKLRDLKSEKEAEFNTMQSTLQAEIDNLKEQLRKERDSMMGSAKEIQQKLQAEIDDLKRMLHERTGQLEVASNTIIERNEEITKLRDQIAELQKDNEEKIAQLERKIKELEEMLENERNNGAQGEQKLLDEIRKLKQQLEDQIN